MVEISVIVPIYNMEKLMRKCLDSILAQTFQNYECLLIDDGSTDDSPAVCDEYAAKDNRFKVFHKPNGGLSDARNYGLEQAQGEYTIFFDPDDWVEDGCLEDLYAKAQETGADMVICDYFNDDLHRSQYSKQSPDSLDHTDVLRNIITGKLYGYTWNKLLKRALYKRFDLEYPKGMYGCEDQYTMCKLLKNDIKVAYLPKAYYHYMHYGNATQSRRYDEKTYQQDVKIRDMFGELLEETPYCQLAYDYKSKWILHRAFMFGSKVFTSKKFKTTFRDYRKYSEDVSPSYLKFFYQASFAGWYRPARFLFSSLYQLKQLLKKSRFLIWL